MILFNHVVDEDMNSILHFDPASSITSGGVHGIHC